MGLRGGVQLEWYKRVVPAGRNKITCGGEQTNTLSSDNEHLLPLHTQGYALWVFSSLFVEHLVFSCLSHTWLIVLDVRVQCLLCALYLPHAVFQPQWLLYWRVCSAKDKQGGNTCGHRRVLAAFFGPALLLHQKPQALASFSSNRPDKHTYLSSSSSSSTSSCYMVTSLLRDDALQRNAASHA